MTVAPIAGAVAGETTAGAAAAQGGAAAGASRAAGTSSAGATPRAGGGRRSAAGSRSKPRVSKTGTPPAPAAAPAPEPSSSSSSSAGEQLRTAGANLGAGIADGARSLTLTPPKKLTASDGAGFLGGLLIYALFLNYLRYGQDGVKGWLAAKFVNRPWTPPDDGGGDGSPSSSIAAPKPSGGTVRA